jgi:hypothetical protein
LPISLASVAPAGPAPMMAMSYIIRLNLSKGAIGKKALIKMTGYG